MHPAELDDTALARVKTLEAQLGCPLVGYEPRSERQRATIDTAPARSADRAQRGSAMTPYAPLTDEQLAQLRRTEAELGVQLLAYRR